MIFRPELAAKVAAGTKTVTRRPMKQIRATYRVGRDYSVQPGRTKRGIARIQIASVDAEPLGNVELPREAICEGFADAAEFIAYWNRLYGPCSYDPATPVWRIEFRLCGPCVGCRTMTTVRYDTGLDPDLPSVWACSPAHVQRGLILMALARDAAP